MKKFLLGLLILMAAFGGYLLYAQKEEDKIPVLEIEEEIIKVDEIYIYGTHLNLHGNVVKNSGLQLVLYNGDFIPYEINVVGDNFNLAGKINEGIYLDDIPRGDYFLFLRSKETNSEGVDEYKYYSLVNNTEYKETKYYTFSNFNNMITINSEDTYPTMMMHVVENKDSDIYDVVIDPGHGGMDGGASSDNYKETDFTMDLALGVKEKLEEAGLKIKLTHEEGQLTKNDKLKEYGVHGRAIVPYEVKAKYLFSLHINSSTASSVNGLEVYTADNINYDFARLLADNITSGTGLNYSTNKLNKVYAGIYTRSFTEEDISNSISEYEDKNLKPYDITTKSNYYYIIRETGGIVTGAYVDNRNDKIIGNPYVLSNVGTEAYLLELGYISNKNNLNNLIENMESYISSISSTIIPLYKKSSE